MSNGSGCCGDPTHGCQVQNQEEPKGDNPHFDKRRIKYLTFRIAHIGEEFGIPMEIDLENLHISGDGEVQDSFLDNAGHAVVVKLRF